MEAADERTKRREAAEEIIKWKNIFARKYCVRDGKEKVFSKRKEDGERRESGDEREVLGNFRRKKVPSLKIMQIVYSQKGETNFHFPQLFITFNNTFRVPMRFPF